MTRKEIAHRIAEIEQELATLPIGTLVYKKIKNNMQPYLQWTENGKTRSQYIKVDSREEILAGVERRKELIEELRQLKSERDSIAISSSYSFKTNITAGEELDRQIAGVNSTWGQSPLVTGMLT